MLRLIKSLNLFPTALNATCSRTLSRTLPHTHTHSTSVDHAHILGHTVAVEVGRAERLFRHHVSGGEDDKVDGSLARRVGGAGQDGEDARVRVIEADGAHGAKVGEIVWWIPLW